MLKVAMGAELSTCQVAKGCRVWTWRDGTFWGQKRCRTAWGCGPAG